MSFEELEHTADVRIRVLAKSREELFISAANAMFGILYPGECSIRSEKIVLVDGENAEELLWEFLSELLFISEVESFVVCETTVQFTKGGLTGLIRGEPFERNRHGGGREIKGVSYSGLFIRQEGAEFNCEIIFDI
ncbi:MAG: archease [Methanocalculus sp.]|uniref:archease n=1 Tax=Methanocalculus sp. TaxID=2004547 RepID=UPI00271D37B4|nr:archease [Methanocalculus sp.]MDO8841617.1 archease [Methanocalculus sp.]MDO9540642.1 archease [Methanocalculus sp.]